MSYRYVTEKNELTILKVRLLLYKTGKFNLGNEQWIPSKIFVYLLPRWMWFQSIAGNRSPPLPLPEHISADFPYSLPVLFFTPGWRGALWE